MLLRILKQIYIFIYMEADEREKHTKEQHGAYNTRRENTYLRISTNYQKKWKLHICELPYKVSNPLEHSEGNYGLRSTQKESLHSKRFAADRGNNGVTSRGRRELGGGRPGRGVVIRGGRELGWSLAFAIIIINITMIYNSHRPAHFSFSFMS